MIAESLIELCDLSLSAHAIKNASDGVANLKKGRGVMQKWCFIFWNSKCPNQPGQWNC